MIVPHIASMRPAAFSPLSLSGLYAAPPIALCRQRSKLWQDAGKTTLAVAANDPVRVVKCPFTGVEFTSPSDAARPLLGNSGSLWYLTFDMTDDCLDFPGTVSKPYSSHFAFRFTNAPSNTPLASGVGNSMRLYVANTAGMRGQVVGVVDWTTAGTTINNATVYVGGLNYGASGTARYMLNAVDDGQADPDVSNDVLTSNVTRLAGNVDASAFFGGRLYGWAMYAASQSAAAQVRLQRWLGKYAGLVL